MTRSARVRVAATAALLSTTVVLTACGSGSKTASSSPPAPAPASNAAGSDESSTALVATSSSPESPKTPSSGTSAASGSQAGTSPAPEDAASATAVAADVSMLPADVKNRGSLTVATTDGNAPWAFYKQGSSTPTGVDADLLTEAAKRLGLTVTWKNVQFTAGIPGVESGRYDFYVSAMADSKAREKVVNFVGYSKEGSGVIVPKGNPKNVKTMKDLCGLKVSIVTGSIFPDVVKKLNTNECAGKNVQLSETADQAAPFLAVASGQADASMNTYGVSNYIFKTATEGVQTKLELSPVPLFAPAVQGIAFSKKNAPLMKAIGAALQKMADDGTYQQIMKKWDVSDGALTKIVYNAPLF